MTNSPIADVDANSRDKDENNVMLTRHWLPEHPVYVRRCVCVCGVTVAARRHGDDREKAGRFSRKRRKYQRDRYKYGAIYDSLMYS